MPRSRLRRAWVAGAAVVVAIALGVVATGGPLTDGHGDDLVLDPLRSVYAAGDPQDVEAFAGASLPSDLAAELLADGPLDATGLEPAVVSGEVVVGDHHAHVVQAADGAHWCVTEAGTVVYDCMLAWQFAQATSSDGVRAAARLRYYPDRTVVVVEMVNETTRPLDPRGPRLPTQFGELLAAPTISVGPADELGPITTDNTWEPGERALVKMTVSEDVAEAVMTSQQFDVSWAWGSVRVQLLETTWLLGPRSEEAEGADHDH